ncbi:MAG TPA: glycosyltransferase family 4 protein [Candidatus Bathyarchaeia archaeon]|nr:glycosyltransferase family 4 protein [Candidatus Bathyarchaeia archaeon]
MEACITPRIAISVIEDISRTNGTTVRARGIIKILRKQYKILIIERAASTDSRFLASSKINKNEILFIGPRGTKLWSLKLITTLVRNRFNCVYCVADMFGFVTYFLLSRLFKYKVIFEAHALAYKEIRQVSKVGAIFYLFLETFIGKNADAVIALSGVAFRFYNRLNGNVFFVPVFVDDQLFRSGIVKQRKKMKKVVGLVGPFDIVPNKYQLDFLYSNLDRFDERIRFKIIGKCDRRLSDGRIEYAGYVGSTELYLRILRQLDALMVPAKIATFGPKNKILEAMACGVPTFTTPEGIVGLDFARPNENIFVFENDDLVTKVNENLFNENSLEKIRANARETVKRSYSKRTLKAKILQVLKGTLRDA